MHVRYFCDLSTHSSTLFFSAQCMSGIQLSTHSSAPFTEKMPCSALAQFSSSR
jgi:hypothetical protein